MTYASAYFLIDQFTGIGQSARKKNFKDASNFLIFLTKIVNIINEKVDFVNANRAKTANKCQLIWVGISYLPFHFLQVRLKI